MPAINLRERVLRAPSQCASHPALAAGLLLIVGAGCASPAGAAEPGDFTVVGDVSPVNHKDYVWQVTNNSTQPIVRFRVPHYLGHRMRPPAGWTQTEITGDIVLGQKQAPGIVECAADTRNWGLRPGATATFTLGLLPTSTGLTRPQPVTVGLVDGTEVVIAGVDCPAREPFVRRNMALIGLGGLFVIFVAAKAVFGRPKGAEAAAATPGDKRD